jgi:hypothetical protein
MRHRTVFFARGKVCAIVNFTNELVASNREQLLFRAMPDGSIPTTATIPGGHLRTVWNRGLTGEGGIRYKPAAILGAAVMAPGVRTLMLASRKDIMSDLLPLHAFREPPSHAFDLGDLIQDVCASLESHTLPHRVQLETDVPPYLMVAGDRDQWATVLDGLIRNAIVLTQRGGDVIVTAFEHGDAIEVEVADTRAAVTERQQREFPYHHVTGVPPVLFAGFERLQHIVQMQGGQVQAEVCPDGGVAFTLTLPRNERPGADRLKHAA